MTETQPNPPRVVRALVEMLVRPSDAESIPGDLLEEYREVRRPLLGRLRADMWYIKQVLSVLWRLMWRCAVAIAAFRIFSFPLVATDVNPSLVPSPGVSVIDALILVWTGYYGSRRTGRISTGIITAIATTFVSLATFCAYALIVDPTLLQAPFEKPFIFAIMSIVLMLALSFGLVAGTAGAAAGRWLRSGPPKTRLT